jgi:hypothetical protein
VVDSMDRVTFPLDGQVDAAAINQDTQDTHPIQPSTLTLDPTHQ